MPKLVRIATSRETKKFVSGDVTISSVKEMISELREIPHLLLHAYLGEKVGDKNYKHTYRTMILLGEGTTLDDRIEYMARVYNIIMKGRMIGGNISYDYMKAFNYMRRLATIYVMFGEELTVVAYPRACRDLGLIFGDCMYTVELLRSKR